MGVEAFDGWRKGVVSVNYFGGLGMEARRLACFLYVVCILCSDDVRVV